MSQNNETTTERSRAQDDDQSSEATETRSQAVSRQTDGESPMESDPDDLDPNVLLETTPSIKPALVYLGVTLVVGLAVVAYVLQNPTLLGDTATTEIALNIVAILWAIALIRLLFQIYVLIRTTYFVTDRAVRREYDILYREWSRELPLVQIRGHDRSRSRLQQTFGIGTIAFLTAGNARSPGHLEFVHIADDDEVRRQVRRLIEAEHD